MSELEPDASPDDTGLVVSGTNLTKTYTRGSVGRVGRMLGREAPTITALDGVDVTINAGERVGIKGPSGSGKTTLLHILAGLDTPTRGRVHLGGRTLTGASERQRAAHRLRTVGIVFQRFHLLPALSARANVALPLVQLGYSKRERRDRAMELLERVGLGDRATHKPGELSGGEQQRVAIARALVTDPLLLVADEPTGELDTDTAARILDLLADITDDRAVVIASHDEQALDITDRIIELRDGRLVSDE